MVIHINERKQEVLRKYELFDDLRKKKGETLTEVAEKTGIERSTFSHWKSGNYVPKTEKMIAICEHFGVPIKYFYD